MMEYNNNNNNNVIIISSSSTFISSSSFIFISTSLLMTLSIRYYNRHRLNYNNNDRLSILYQILDNKTRKEQEEIIFLSLSCKRDDVVGTQSSLSSSSSPITTANENDKDDHNMKLSSMKSSKATTTTTTTIWNHDNNHNKDDILYKRKQYFSKCLSISYENSDPCMMMKGIGSHLYDERLISYLDTRNNVVHCGHCHPNIVYAIQKQVQQLNTNTRYIHPITTQLAEILLSLFPTTTTTNSDGITIPFYEKVFFVNSGSEANDLALRLAKSYSSGSTNTIVIDHAYHGHTMATLEVSPYKYEHEPIIEYASSMIEQPCVRRYNDDQADQSSFISRSPGKHIWKVPCPDIYRGIHRNVSTAGYDYSQYVIDACEYYKNICNESVRCVIIEGGMSVGGVIIPPTGYIERCIKAVHDAGGLYIADEIQTGFGRLGKSMWAFEYIQQHNTDNNIMLPDIVTIGKPFGNGMPLAAVVTTRRVTDAFENNKIEYFNIFGGNPVCAIAGLSMIQTLQGEQLQQNAINVGGYIQQQLYQLQNDVIKHHDNNVHNNNNSIQSNSNNVVYIGDIRGDGFFQGIDFVTNIKTRQPATIETSYICTILKNKYCILTSIDGPYNNIIVFKPPMVFTMNDAIYFISSLRTVLLYDIKEEYNNNDTSNNNDDDIRKSYMTPT